MSRNRAYSPAEDDVIRDGHAAGLNSRQISDKLASRSPSSVRERAEKLGLSFSRGGVKKIADDDRRIRGEVRRRTCLVGGHEFDARVDENGRFLEFSCPSCRWHATQAERSALL